MAIGAKSASFFSMAICALLIILSSRPPDPTFSFMVFGGMMVSARRLLAGWSGVVSDISLPKYSLYLLPAL
jgi:hypothetical protein